MPTYTGTSAFSINTLENSGVASVTYSNDQSLIYVARRDGHIDVFNRATHGLVTSWTVGTGLGGMSLSEDGTFLLVTEEPNSSGSPVVHRVSTADGSVQNYTDSAIPSGTFHDVEIVDAHTAILSGASMVKLNLDTGAFSYLPGAAFYSSGQSVLVEDKHLTLIAEPGISNGPLFIYDDRTGTVTTAGDDYQSGVNSGFNWGDQAISEAAGQIAQFTIYGSINLYDLSLHAIGTVPTPTRVDGLAYDKSGTYFYAYLIDDGVLAKYSVANFTLVDQISVGGSNWHNHIGAGDQIHVSDDGNYITLSDTNGPPYDANGGHLQLIDLTARNEFFAGTGGADTFYGLDGNDTYVVNNVGDVVVEAAANGADIVQTDLASYTLPANVEVLLYTGGSVFFTGNGNTLDNILNASSSTGGVQMYGGAGNDNLFGGSGNDLLDGGTGRDLMAGGLGGDTYIVDSVTDIVVENPNEGQDTIATYLDTYALSETGNVENLTLLDDLTLHQSGITGYGNSLDNVLIGDSLANTLYGNGGNDRLISGAGNDTLIGGTGNDTYVVESLGDVVVENAGEGNDTVETALTYSLAGLANVENLTLTGTAAVDATGNASANVLRGNVAANMLIGNGGTDTLIGGLGDDLYVVTDSSTVIVENAGEGNDTIRSSVSYTLGAGVSVETMRLFGTASVNLTGNADYQVLGGNSGNNVLDGGGGGDQLKGAAGDDTYIVRSASDHIVEVAGEGNDTVKAALSYTLGAAAQVEHLVTLDASATTAINLTGNAYSHDIQGNAGANVLTGGTGDDVLQGFGGNDTLFGGAGADRFVFDHGTGQDVVSDFVSGTDKLDLSAFGFADFTAVQAATHDVGGNAVIDLGGGDSVTLTGVTSSQLQSGDVILSGGGGQLPLQIGTEQDWIVIADTGYSPKDDAVARHFPIHFGPVALPAWEHAL